MYFLGDLQGVAVSTLAAVHMLATLQTEPHLIQGLHYFMMLRTEQSLTHLEHELSNFLSFSDSTAKKDKGRGRKCGSVSWRTVKSMYKQAFIQSLHMYSTGVAHHELPCLSSCLFLPYQSVCVRLKVGTFMLGAVKKIVPFTRYSRYGRKV